MPQRLMQAWLIAGLFSAASFASAAFAQAPPALSEPPASAKVWTIRSAAGPHGRESVWTTPDGAIHSRQSRVLRGFVTELDQTIRTDAQGRVIGLTIRGVTPEGPVEETFEAREGRARWRSNVDSGEAAAGAAYIAFRGTVNAEAELVRELMRAPGQARDLFPSGRARLERLAALTVRRDSEEKRLVAWALIGVAWYPLVYWFDENGDFFGAVSWLSWLPHGWEHVDDALSQTQDSALKARAPALVAQLGRRPSAPVVFQDVRLYDADARRFRSHMSVVVSGDRITAVGPAHRITAPAGAEIVPGAGRTLAPGLWDSHMHFGDDTWGPLLLSLGITTVRDPGNRAAELEDRIRRINAGELLGPRVLASLIMDRPGPFAAQAAKTANNVEEALAHVRYAQEHGYIGVKLYGTIDPAWVAPIAAEAHRLGLRVSGHIPAGMRPLDAVRAGYDEITHLNFTFMQAMPDDVVAASNGLQRFFGPGRYGADVDLSRAPMKPFLDELARRRITLDPTLAVFEAIFVPERGQVTPAYAPYLGAVPAAVEREFKSGGLNPPEGLSRERMRLSFARMREAISELHRRRITIIAGTDGYGHELIRELELYVEAGLSPADALATATIVPARLFGLDDRTGSIKPGKLAELTLVEGDPEARIGDLRHVVMVMRDGRLMDAAAIRTALGLGAPH